MRTKFFIILFSLSAFLAFLSCSKHDNDDGGDCRDIVISDDRRKLLSPQWMVHIFDSLENEVFDTQLTMSYYVFSIDYNHKTYIKIVRDSWVFRFTGPFFSCSGEKVIPGDFYWGFPPDYSPEDDPLYIGLVNANFQPLFKVDFCYLNGAGCLYRYGTTYGDFIWSSVTP